MVLQGNHSSPPHSILEGRPYNRPSSTVHRFDPTSLLKTIYMGWIKSNGNSSIFLKLLYIYRGTTFMYLEYSPPLIYHYLPNVWKASYTISTSIFVDVLY